MRLEYELKNLVDFYPNNRDVYELFLPADTTVWDEKTYEFIDRKTRFHSIEEAIEYIEYNKELFKYDNNMCIVTKIIL